MSVSSYGFVDTYCPPPKDGGVEKLVVGGYFVVRNDTVVVQPGWPGEGSGNWDFLGMFIIKAIFACIFRAFA